MEWRLSNLEESAVLPLLLEDCREASCDSDVFWLRLLDVEAEDKTEVSFGRVLDISMLASADASNFSFSANVRIRSLSNNFSPEIDEASRDFLCSSERVEGRSVAKCSLL